MSGMFVYIRRLAVRYGREYRSLPDGFRRNELDTRFHSLMDCLEPSERDEALRIYKQSCQLEGDA